MVAQSNISGKIIDGTTNETLIGATVIVQGTTNGTTSDIDGNFTLQDVTLPATLVFSYTGYESIEMPIATAEFINLNMSTNSETLDEVLVVGYGQQKKRVATGAIAKLSAEDIEGIVVSDVASTLEGQVTGLIVSEASGQPGASKAILIRGISTNGDNSPLFILDGLQVGSIDNINPGDIESVDVLKDAASSAIYGARAANGVVIITTKKGKSDTGGNITVESNIVNSRPWRTPELLNSQQYVELTREKFANSNQLNSLNVLGFPQVGDALPNNTDWNDVVFSPANVYNTRLSANIKNAFVSLDYYDERGVVGGDDSRLRRYSARVNSTKEINDFVTIGENINIFRVENRAIPINNAFGTVIADAFALDPLTGVFNENRQYGFEQSEWVQKEYINPLSRLFIQNDRGHTDQLQGNVFLEVKPIKGLRLRTDIGGEIGWFNFNSFVPDYEFHSAFIRLENQVTQGYGTFQNLQWENYANYTTDIRGKHTVDLVAGSSYRQNDFVQVSGTTQSIPQEVQFDPNFHFLDAGQDTSDLASGFANVDYRLISYFGRLQYDYDDKYLFTATLRRDGSSNFGINNRWGLFPSFSAGWVVTKEPFFNGGPISFLKLRGSWGINGNDRIRPLSFASTIQNVFTYAFGTEPVLFTGSALNTPPNPDIKWEESNQTDIGIEAEFLEGKWTLDADVYRKTTRDLLLAEVIPGFIGANNNPISNLGEIRNQGIEISIGNRSRINGLTLRTNLNYTHFTNEVISIAGDSDFIAGWNWPVRNTAITRLTPGFPVAHFVGFEAAGIFQSQAEIFSHINSNGDLLQPNAQPGDIIFLDSNGDGVINTDDITDIGNPWPDHIIGLTLSGSYKNFDFSFILSSQIGHDIFRTYERSDVTFTNYQTFWLDRWTEDNPSTEFPRLVTNDANNNQRPSSFYVEDGTFVRLKNIQIGYSLPSKILKKAQIQDLRIYLTANNLITLTNYEGYDPDIGTNGQFGNFNILDTGIDKGFYPSNRTFGGGIKITL